MESKNISMFVWIFGAIGLIVLIFGISSEVLIDNITNPDCVNKAGYDLENPDDSTDFAKYCLEGNLVSFTQITIVMLVVLPFLLIALLRLAVWD